MSRERLLIVVGLVASLTATYLSSELLHMHAVGSSDLGLLSGVCGEDGEGCEAVINSRWGVFPPGPAETESEGASGGEDAPTESSGIPVAAIGLFYYSALSIWFAAVGRARGRSRRLQDVVTGLAVLGGIGSIAFMGIMWGAIGTSCVLCLGSHLANFAVITCLFLIRRLPAGEETWPSRRFGLVVAALMVAVPVAQWNDYRADKSALQTGQVEELRARLNQLETLEKDVERLEAMHLSLEKEELNIRPDDPKISAKGGGRMQLAMFGDIECEHCSRFYRFLRDEIIPTFNGNIEVVYKHYPLNVHKNAWAGAKAMEAARLQGKFWEMHDALHERRTELARVDYVAVARTLGLNADKFQKDMASKPVRDRIQADINTGRKLELRNTPAVFLNKRPVSRLFRSNAGFWKLRADRLKVARARAKQPW